MTADEEKRFRNFVHHFSNEWSTFPRKDVATLLAEIDTLRQIIQDEVKWLRWYDDATPEYASAIKTRASILEARLKEGR